MGTNKEWKKIHFSIDLINLAIKHIQFLAYIDSEKVFYEDEILKRAIYRYEKYWLPLCAKLIENGCDILKLYPPTDVAWVNFDFNYLLELA